MTASDAEFLRWVAGWLDRIDPILQAVFAKSKEHTQEERDRIVEWLDGEDVQMRLRSLAAALSTEDNG